MGTWRSIVPTECKCYFFRFRLELELGARVRSALGKHTRTHIHTQVFPNFSAICRAVHCTFGVFSADFRVLSRNFSALFSAFVCFSGTAVSPHPTLCVRECLHLLELPFKLKTIICVNNGDGTYDSTAALCTTMRVCVWLCRSGMAAASRSTNIIIDFNASRVVCLMLFASPPHAYERARLGTRLLARTAPLANTAQASRQAIA